MRTLSSTLLGAQKSASSAPYVKVEVFDRVGGVARLRFKRHYTGSEPDDFHDATMPSDSSLIRARVEDTTQHDLYIQRVANPTPTSDFSSWTLVTQVSSVADVALCSQGSRVLLVYISSNKQSIYAKESTNNGQTYGSPVLVATASTSVKWMTAALKTDGTALLIYTTGAASLRLTKRTSGVWSGPTLWSNSMSDIDGVAVVYDNDWNVVVTGKDDNSKPGVWTSIYGDGSAQTVDTWSGLMNLTIADDGSGVTFQAPFVAKPDLYRTSFVERYSGSSSYDVPFLSFTVPSSTFSDSLWREPIPFDLICVRGIAMAHSGTEVWLSTPYGVWSASLDPAPLDISQDVLGVRESMSPFASDVEIELRNDDGKYYSAGSGPLDMLQKGSEVRVSPGYRTTAGIEVSSGTTCWIEGWEFRRYRGRSTMVLYTRGWWGLLESWRARRQFTWQAGAKNVSDLLTAVLARAGLEFAPGATTSGSMSSHYPSLTIHPGETAATAIRRLLSMVPDTVFFALTNCTSLNPQSSDTSVYSYGTDHAILHARYADLAPVFNRVQVFGSSVFNESYDWADMHLVYDRLRQVHDINLDTSQKAADQVARELRHQTMDQSKGDIVVPVNAGQELYDVIDLTDSEAGMQATPRRVMGIRTEYKTTGNQPRYIQTLYLGGV